MIALAGVVLTVGHDGCVAATEGLVRKADQKQLDAIRRQAATTEREHAGDAPSGQGDKTGGDEPRNGNLSKAVARDLTTERTRAIRQRVAVEPDIALAICVTSCALRSLRHADMSGVALATRACEMDDGDGFSRLWAEADAPHEEADMLRWCLSQDREALLAMLAVLVGGVIDLRHEDATPADHRKQSIADLLAQALNIDMTQVWHPGLDYWIRLSKAALIEALAQAGDHASSATAPAALLASCAKLKKDALAQKVGTCMERKGIPARSLGYTVGRWSVRLDQDGRSRRGGGVAVGALSGWSRQGSTSLIGSVEQGSQSETAHVSTRTSNPPKTIRLPSNGIAGKPPLVWRGSAMNFAVPVSRVALSGHQIQENTTTSSG